MGVGGHSTAASGVSHTKSYNMSRGRGVEDICRRA